MKFTDGFWLTKPGVTLHHCTQVRDVRVLPDRVLVYASYARILHRGMTLVGPLFTLCFKAPQPDILSLTVEHFQGIARKEPLFALHEEPCALRVEQDGDTIVIAAGDLRAVITKDVFSLSFEYAGKRLTGLRDRHLGYADTPQGRFMRAKLDVGVGEKLYGLGERFTPFVRNGQSIDIWNEDGGTASELAYKNIPFYVSNRGYGVFVNSTDRVSYELCSEAVTSAQFSVPGEKLQFMILAGPTMKQAISRFTSLTGRPALPPAWSFGLWLTTSFTTEYSEETINEFVDGMLAREIPLSVFHFDCFWMRESEWCNFQWDSAMFPDAQGMLNRLRAKGLRICVWINPYIAQKSPLFAEGMANGYLLKRANGDVWQWDRWQAGMGLVDFTNPDACAWYQRQLKQLMDMGVDSFKTDFGERIPTDCVYHDGSDPVLMHNYYTQLYNQTVFELLERERGVGEACVFARSATVGGQQYPVHWGGDSSSNYPSMAESLRAGLSLCMCGFAFWSHDISGFEDMATPDVYKRWAAFGLLSTHSRLHGSSSYRVPWLFGEEAVDVVRHFARLKCRLMPYLFSMAVHARDTGEPVMRACVLEFPDDPACEELDRQYMLGDRLLVAPVFREDGIAEYYLPEGSWTHLLTNEEVRAGGWRREAYDYFSLPLFVRENTLIPLGENPDTPEYDYLRGLTIHAYSLREDTPASITVYDAKADGFLRVNAKKEGEGVRFELTGRHEDLRIVLHQPEKYTKACGAALAESLGSQILIVEPGAEIVACS